jgi:multiple sugar transport system substrate-binding protein
MRILFSAILVVLVGWTMFMLPTSRDPVPVGKTIVTWATDDTPIRREQIALFNKLNPNLDLRIDPTNNDPNKVVVQSIGGVGPDVFDMPGTTLKVFVDSGIALDLTEELPKLGYDPLTEIWPAAKPLFAIEDRTYGVPANLDTLAIYYNREVFDEMKLPYPPENPTWDDIIAIGKKLTVKDASGRTTRYGLLFWWDWRDFFAMCGARLFSDDGRKLTIDTPEALEAVNLMSSLIYVHKLAPTAAESNSMASVGGWGSGNESRFVGRRAAMVVGPRYFTGNFRRAPDLKVGVVKLPLSATGSTRLKGRTIAVNSRSPRRAAALRFVKFVSDGGYNRLNNDLADGVGPTMKYTEEPKFQFNPDFPEEKYNPIWRQSMLAARPDESSPYISNGQVDEIVGFQLDLVNQGIKDPKAALVAAQLAGEKLVQDNLAANAALAKRYAEGSK